jgi:hypothetical protein
MLLDQNLKSEIRKIFEGEDYYNRPLSDIEIQVIADNLVMFTETIIKIAKNSSPETEGV